MPVVTPLKPTSNTKKNTIAQYVHHCLHNKVTVMSLVHSRFVQQQPLTLRETPKKVSVILLVHNFFVQQQRLSSQFLNMRECGFVLVHAILELFIDHALYLALLETLPCRCGQLHKQAEWQHHKKLFSYQATELSRYMVHYLQSLLPTHTTIMKFNRRREWLLQTPAY